MTVRIFSYCSFFVLNGRWARQANELADMAALSEAEIITIAYIEAARGDVDLALRWAIGALLACEEQFATALRSVSHGFIRGQLPRVVALRHGTAEPQAHLPDLQG